MNLYRTFLKRSSFRRFSNLKSVCELSMMDFFEHNFEEHRNNMKSVVFKFESLSLPEKLHLKSHIISELRQGKPFYQNSRAINWLLREKNVSKIIQDALRESESLELKQLSEIMIISQGSPRDEVVNRVISRMRELVPFVQNAEDLSWLIKTIQSVKSTPTRKWNATERLLDLQELIGIEHSTRLDRTPNQQVELFVLIKEFDLSTLSELEVEMLQSIIENIQDVDPALYLKLTLDLLSHFLFEFSAKRVDGKPIAQLMSSLSLEDLKKQVPTLELFERLTESQYDPCAFCSSKLIETVPLFRPLTSLASLSFYELFPRLAERVASIGNSNLQKNFQNRSVIEQLFKIPVIEAKSENAGSELMLGQLSNLVTDVAQIQEDLRDILEQEGIPGCGEEFTEHMIRFKNDIDMETKTFRTSVTRMISEQQYPNLLKLALFFETCFHYCCPVYFYCSHYRHLDPGNPLFASFADFSLDLLVYLCKMGRALVKKIREFDLEENISIARFKFENDEKRLQEEISQLYRFHEENQEVLHLIQKTVVSKLSYFRQMDASVRSRVLIDNMQKLKDLLN